MTDHADLSRRLALAIGYAPDCVRVRKETVSDDGSTVVEVDTVFVWHYVYRLPRYADNVRHWWNRFDYTDPSVCLPVLEWLFKKHDARMRYNAEKYNIWHRLGDGYDVLAPTLPEAVALAAIAVGVKP